MRKAKVSLVVLNYNGRGLLREYMNSLFSQTLIPDEIIFLDNNSSDDSVSFIEKRYPSVTIVKTKENCGTAEGSNIGFKHTTGDFVIFQSNDVRLDKNCVKELVDVLSRNAKIGICTSVLLKWETQLIDNVGGIIDVFGFPMQKYPNVDVVNIPETAQVFFSYGGSFIIRRDVFRKVDGFDSRYFTLNDDLDLGWRTRILGYDVIYTKKSVVHHLGSATLGSLFDRPFKHYLSERNALRTFLKNQDFLHLSLFIIPYFMILFAETIYLFLRGKFSLVLADLKAIFWNIIYLPETIRLRWKIQVARRKNNVNELLEKTSFKLRLFKAFSKVL